VVFVIYLTSAESNTFPHETVVVLCSRL